MTASRLLCGARACALGPFGTGGTPLHLQAALALRAARTDQLALRAKDNACAAIRAARGPASR